MKDLNAKGRQKGKEKEGKRELKQWVKFPTLSPLLPFLNTSFEQFLAINLNASLKR